MKYALSSALGIIILSLSAFAQNDSRFRSDTQIWPEATLSFRLRPDTALFFYGSVREGRDVTAIVAKHIGIGINYSFNEHFAVLVSYRYVGSDPVPDRHQDEHRYFFDFTGRTTLSHKIAVSNRVRVEFRILNGEFSRRYRDRMQVEREVVIKKHPMTPYLSAEFFYDERFHGWARQQYFAGLRIPINEHLTLENYFMKQLNQPGIPARISIIGMHFRLSY